MTHQDKDQLAGNDPSKSWVAGLISWSVSNQLIVLMLAAALAVMRKWYNGYLFPGASQRVFNPQISLFFMRKFTDDRDVKEATLRDIIAPEDLVSRNLRVTESMLGVLATSRAGTGPLAELLGGASTYTLHGRVVDEFRFSDLMRWSVEGIESESEDKFCSYLYYHGALTFAERPHLFAERLCIPNELVRREFWDVLPATTLITPAGMPARSASSAIAKAESGVSVAGLITMLHPAARMAIRISATGDRRRKGLRVWLRSSRIDGVASP